MGDLKDNPAFTLTDDPKHAWMRTELYDLLHDDGVVTSVSGQMWRPGVVALHTYAGRAQSVTQHLTAVCFKLRTSRTLSRSWTPDQIDVWLHGDNRRKLCPTCITGRPSATGDLARLLLFRALTDVDRFVNQSTTRSFVPRMVEWEATVRHLARAVELTDRWSAQPYVPHYRRIVAVLDAVTAHLGQLAAAPVTLPVRQLASLAAATAGRPNHSTYWYTANPQGRTLTACASARRSPMMTATFVADLHKAFVRFIERSDDPTTAVFMPDGPTVQELPDTPSGEQLLAVTSWVVDVDRMADVSPDELLLTNWQQVALGELRTLIGDWHRHVRQVFDGDTTRSFLLVHATVPTDRWGEHCRFDELKLLVDRFAPQPLADGEYFAFDVPTSVARALDGFRSTDGAVAAVSLEGMPADRLVEVAATVRSLRESFPNTAWLTEAARAAVACLE